MNSDHEKVLGSYADEMDRRRANAGRNLRRDAPQLLAALCLVLFGVWPLGFWHAAALVGGLVWAVCIAEEQASRVADDIDLLEEKIVARFAEMK
jgi:hypothetical protein